jgi:hypothetical protein
VGGVAVFVGAIHGNFHVVACGLVDNGCVLRSTGT